MTAITNERGLAIGALSKRAGVNIETIRYYERIGIMPQAFRRQSGHRFYDRAQLKRLVFIRRGRELGFGLDDIRTLLTLEDRGALTCEEVHDVVQDHARAVKAKIGDLQRLASVLDAMASECGKGRVPECPVIDALYED